MMLLHCLYPTGTSGAICSSKSLMLSGNATCIEVGTMLERGTGIVGGGSGAYPGGITVVGYVKCAACGIIFNSSISPARRTPTDSSKVIGILDV